MATVDAVPSSPTFNCFVSLDDATDYMYTRLYTSTWHTADLEERTAALLWATKLLDTLSWKGTRTETDQNLSWPRDGVTLEDGLDELDSTTVPQQIKDATAQLALELLSSDTTAPTGTEGLSRIRVDVIDIQIKSSDRTNWFSRSVRSLCSQLMTASSSYNYEPIRT